MLGATTVIDASLGIRGDRYGRMPPVIAALSVLQQYPQYPGTSPSQSVQPAVASGVLSAILLLELFGALLFMASSWRIFTKAGEPGWWALMPFLNFYTMLRVGNRPGWWLGVFIVLPVATFMLVLAHPSLWLLIVVMWAGMLAMSILVTVGVGQAFDKDGGFIVGMVLLPFVFYPILAFGRSTYGGINPYRNQNREMEPYSLYGAPGVYNAPPPTAEPPAPGWGAPEAPGWSAPSLPSFGAAPTPPPWVPPTSAPPPPAADPSS